MPKVSRAKSGERMIEVKVRFWTNNIAGKEGCIIPKNAWSSGVVRMEPNSSHVIRPKNPKPFRSLMHLPFVVERVLIDHGIKLHSSRLTKKYTR